MDDLLALSANVLDSADANDDTNHIVNRITNELSEVTDGLAMVESFSHSVLVDAGDELVAFDASHANTGGAVVDAISGWTDKPVRHLVYTHGHADHVGGSPAFAAKFGDLDVHGHEQVAARFARYRETNGWQVAINARQFGGVRAEFPMGDDEPDFIPSNTLEPDHVVGDHAEFTVGDRTFELHHARGETDDHVWGWMPNERWLFVGDFVTWVFPNAGNPQKVQRYPLEWAAALRDMAAREPEVLLPAHGLPIGGTERIVDVLTTIAGALEGIVADVIDMMNAGSTLDEIIHTVRVEPSLLERPYLKPLYDEPEFVVRNVWRQFGGWWDGAPSRLKPAADAALGAELASMAGGADAVAARAVALSEAGDHRLACHLADLAGWAAPDDPAVHGRRADVYLARRKHESSLMAKGIFAGAARESRAIADS